MLERKSWIQSYSDVVNLLALNHCKAPTLHSRTIINSILNSFENIFNLALTAFRKTDYVHHVADHLLDNEFQLIALSCLGLDQLSFGILDVSDSYISSILFISLCQSPTFILILYDVLKFYLV